MTEDEAQAWLIENCTVSRETLDQLDALRQITIEANTQQNLISKSTIPHFWVRHIVDSAQLLLLAPGRSWSDLGSGAGFPGLVLALLDSAGTYDLVEERRLRAEYLRQTAETLGISDRVRIHHMKSEKLEVTRKFDVISARAFAPLEKLFGLAHHLSRRDTIWVLPKGKSSASELEAAARTWQGRFRIEPSITDPDGAIIVATDVQPRGRRR